MHKCAYKSAVKKYMSTVAQKRGSIADADPKIFSEWIENKYSEIDAETISISSNKKYHWRCSDCGNIWLASNVISDSSFPIVESSDLPLIE